MCYLHVTTYAQQSLMVHRYKHVSLRCCTIKREYSSVQLQRLISGKRKKKKGIAGDFSAFSMSSHTLKGNTFLSMAISLFLLLLTRKQSPHARSPSASGLPASDLYKTHTRIRRTKSAKSTNQSIDKWMSKLADSYWHITANTETKTIYFFINESFYASKWI